jgi:hypothetical protein
MRRQRPVVPRIRPDSTTIISNRIAPIDLAAAAHSSATFRNCMHAVAENPSPDRTTAV